MASVTNPINQLTLPGPELRLPPKVWELVFQNLCCEELRSVRRVCTHWRAIVGQKRSLWDRMCLELTRLRFDEKSWLKNPVPASRIVFWECRIYNVDSWWPSIGERLTRIDLLYCGITLGALTQILRYAPGLTHLTLDIGFISPEVEPAVDFQLERMEDLTLSWAVHDVLVKMFPHLRKLRIEVKPKYEGICCRLVQSVQGTLEQLTFIPKPQLMEALSKMDRLALKSVTMNNVADNQSVVELARIQPSLEKMDIYAALTSLNLVEIGENLPNLKELSTNIDREASLAPTFLATMRNLNKLELRRNYRDQAINLGEFESPTLEQLKFEGFQAVGSGLQLSLAGCTNLQQLSLLSHVLESWSELLTMLAYIPALQHLTLERCRVLNNLGNIPTDIRSTLRLKSIQMLYNHDSITSEMITYLMAMSHGAKICVHRL